MRPVPIINLNGTDGQALYHQNIAVLTRLQEVRSAMSEAFPHARDFQPKPENYAKAREQAEDRLGTVGILIEHYEFICKKLLEQIEARKR